MKFMIEKSGTSWRLSIYDEQGTCTDIIEGGARFIVQWMLDIILPGKKLRIRRDARMK